MDGAHEESSLTFCLRHSLEKAGIFEGLYSMIGMTGESLSPSTSNPIFWSCDLKKLLFSRIRASFTAPTTSDRCPNFFYFSLRFSRDPLILDEKLPFVDQIRPHYFPK